MQFKCIHVYVCINPTHLLIAFVYLSPYHFIIVSDRKLMFAVFQQLHLQIR